MKKEKLKNIKELITVIKIPEEFLEYNSEYDYLKTNWFITQVDFDLKEYFNSDLDNVENYEMERKSEGDNDLGKCYIVKVNLKEGVDEK